MQPGRAQPLALVSFCWLGVVPMVLGVNSWGSWSVPWHCHGSTISKHHFICLENSSWDVDTWLGCHGYLFACLCLLPLLQGTYPPFERQVTRVVSQCLELVLGVVDESMATATVQPPPSTCKLAWSWTCWGLFRGWVAMVTSLIACCCVASWKLLVLQRHLPSILLS